MSIIGTGASGIIQMIKTENGSFAKKTVIESHQYFLREVMLLARCQHPNVIRICAVDVISRSFVMETGKITLREKIEVQTSFSTRYCIQVLHQVLAALTCIHANKIAHFDLTASNIIICDDQVKVCDFGSAIYEPDSHYPSLSHINAPEILRKKKCSYPVDIWSLGCIIYKMLFSEQLEKWYKSPIDEEYDRIKRVITSRIARCNMNDQLHQLLLKKMLHFNPNKRITAEEAIGQEIFRHGMQIDCANPEMQLCDYFIDSKKNLSSSEIDWVEIICSSARLGKYINKMDIITTLASVVQNKDMDNISVRLSTAKICKIDELLRHMLTSNNFNLNYRVAK